VTVVARVWSEESAKIPKNLVVTYESLREKVFVEETRELHFLH